MSYLTYPRIHFSGQFKAYPSTINNIDANFDPTIFPHIEEVQLVWAPRGTGEFSIDSKVTMVEYEDGTSATSPEEDPIIGQPFFAVPNQNFIAGALVDLDPDQQGVSEVWGMRIQIGGKDQYIQGDFEPAAFNSMWKNIQGDDAPHSSASFSAVYQSALSNLESKGLNAQSKFFKYVMDNPTSKLSINFIVEAHNNNPLIFAFNKATFDAMAAAKVPRNILDKIAPMQKLKQANSGPMAIPGNVPTEDFVKFQLQQYLNKEEYNSNIDKILNSTTQIHQYKPFTQYKFAHGFTCGTVGMSTPEAPNYFVPSRMMATFHHKQLVNKKVDPYYHLVNFAPFSVSKNGTISLNLSNSLPVENPGTQFWQSKIGDLRLVYFKDGKISLESSVDLLPIPYMEPGFMDQKAGIFTASLNVDVSKKPLGIISTMPDGSNVILLAENKDGYYLRADQFVFRMNPGVRSTSANPRGQSAKLNIHALKFGIPVPDGTKIKLSDDVKMDSGLATPPDALQVTPKEVTGTKNGIATFTLRAYDPGNPRGYINGQLYFKQYAFDDDQIAKYYIADPNDIVSIQVYNQHPDEDSAADILNKYGYLYKIMSFLTDDTSIAGMGMRNNIKTLLQRPFSDIKHMPVTRDLSIANRKKIIDWIDKLNSSSSQAPNA